MIFKRIAFGMLVAAVLGGLVWAALSMPLWATVICGILFVCALVLLAVLVFGAFIASEDDTTEDVETSELLWKYAETRGENVETCLGCGGVLTRPKDSLWRCCALCKLGLHGIPDRDCPHCGPVCYRGAAHNARVEDGVLFDWGSAVGSSVPQGAGDAPELSGSAGAS